METLHFLHSEFIIYEWTLRFKSTEVGEGSLFTCPSDVKVGED